MDWDLTSYFPAFNGPEYQQFWQETRAAIDGALSKAEGLRTLTADNAADFEALFLLAEQIGARVSHLNSYLGCLCAADASNDDYPAAAAALGSLAATYAPVGIALQASLRDTTDEAFAGLCARPALTTAAYRLRRMRADAANRMPSAEEALAAALDVDGADAWDRLYDRLTGQMTFTLQRPDGTAEELSVSRRRSLLGNRDRAVRKAAFDGGNEAFARFGTVFAAALNALAGARHTLNRRRGIEHFLDVACRQAAIRRETLDALTAAWTEERPFIHQLMRNRLRWLGLDKVTYYDLEAPVDLPQPPPELAWEEGSRQVGEAFRADYPKLADFYDEFLQKRHVDYSPRNNKRPGGFCTTSRLTGESRIYMTYDGRVNDAMTLAHEAGHAFHSFILKGERPASQGYPMTLAESASTFGEMIFVDGILHSDADPVAKIALLDGGVRHAFAFLLDIPVRFHFEKKLYEERASGELSVSRLKTLMVETQQEVFGDTLDPDGADPWFWASKGHFYISPVTFYNFPYTFGFLLSRRLYQLFRDEGESFLPRYETFLAETGKGDCEELVHAHLGEDITQPAFWAAAIHSLGDDAAHLDRLMEEVTAAAR